MNFGMGKLFAGIFQHIIQLLCQPLIVFFGCIFRQNIINILHHRIPICIIYYFSVIAALFIL